MPESPPDVLTDRITVEVRGRKYTFRVPSIQYNMEVGYRAAAIRRAADASGRGSLDAIDWNASRFAHCAAVMELYLEKAEVTWPFSASDGKAPVVDHTKWPVNKTMTVFEVGEAFLAEFTRFLDDGTGDRVDPGTEAVAGE